MVASKAADVASSSTSSQDDNLVLLVDWSIEEEKKTKQK